MKPFGHCTHCGGRHMAHKTVDQLVRGGNHVAKVSVPAEVCLDCGERLYAPEVVERFEEIKTRLERGEVKNFLPLGQYLQVA